MTPEVKLFTPQEATRTLPLVRKIVEDILAAGQNLRELSLKIGKGAEDDPQSLNLMDRLDELFEELENLGCSYKDWNFTQGLVDFPCVIEGKEAYLCWRSDEDQLQYYHEAEEGFPGRKLIPRKYFGGES